MKYFEVCRGDLTKFRFTEHERPELREGEILAEVERFAFTANNISYAVVGEKLGYWNFFPAEEGWGIIPVWGFAAVIESKKPEVQVGERLYGYWPMGTHLVMQPGKLRADQLRDMSAHRAQLAAVYNSYARVGGEPHYDPSMDDERMLLMPLYATSYCLYDFLVANDYFGARQVVIPSASSKTAIGLAYALQDDPATPVSVGITSSGNKAHVEALSLYDSVISYEELGTLDASLPTVIVDMSGNGKVLSELHRILGENMKFTSNVGLTHYDANKMGPDFIRERSAMFFAPGHIQKRADEWGPAEFQKRAFEFWRSAAIRSRTWLAVKSYNGMKSASEVYTALREGRVNPAEGSVIVPMKGT